MWRNCIKGHTTAWKSQDGIPCQPLLYSSQHAWAITQLASYHSGFKLLPSLAKLINTTYLISTYESGSFHNIHAFLLCFCSYI